MNDLLKKLNTLVKAGINDLLGDDLAVGAPRRKPLAPDKLGKNIDREITALRQRVNEAVEYEEGLQNQVDKLQGEVSRWDQRADEAVARGDDATARYAIEQMQRAQQRLKMAEADLREHQFVTQELIQRVNTLEAVVADARRAQAEREAEAQASAGEEQADIGPRVLGRGLSDVLREAREKIASMAELVSSQAEAQSTSEGAVDDQAVEDDLTERRQRLSKPK